MGLIFLKLYITAVICGLLQPLIDMVMERYSKVYRKVAEDTPEIDLYENSDVEIKFILIMIPIINTLWIVYIFAIAGMVIRTGLSKLKYRFIRWLASWPLKRLSKFRVIFIKKVFPMQINTYYASLQIFHSKEITEMLVDIIIKAGINEIIGGESDE